MRTKRLRHRPCDGTPNAATVSVTTGRVALLSSKNIVFYFHTPRCGTWRQRDSASRYSYGGGRRNIALIGPSMAELWGAPIGQFKLTLLLTKVAQCLNAPLSFWQRNPYQKRLHIFLSLNAGTVFFAIYVVRLALYVCLKNICDGIGCQNGSNGTPLDPPLFWLDNIFNIASIPDIIVFLCVLGCQVKNIIDMTLNIFFFTISDFQQ